MSGTHAATTGHEGDKNVAQRELYDERFRPGVYKHYKGGFYIAYSVSVNEDTFEALVHYYSCERKTRWTRTMKNFFEILKTENNGRPMRFTFQHAASWLQLAEAAGLDDLVEGLQSLAAAQTFVANIQR